MPDNGSPPSAAPAQSEPLTGRPGPVPRINPRFLSVAAVARALGMSEATMYRAIRSGEFPAIRVRNRYIVPVKAIDALEDAALMTGGTVDAADWVDGTGAA